jgi:hypothetical protein
MKQKKKHSVNVDFSDVTADPTGDVDVVIN